MRCISLLLKLYLLSFCTTLAACEVVDDLSRVVILKHPAKRIVSLAPDLTENLFAVGAGDRMVGVMQGSDYPLAAKKISVVAHYHTANAETVLALHPDLIVAWADGVNVSQWEKWGIPVFFSRPKKLTDISNTLQKLGCLVGNEKIANEAAARYSLRYTALLRQNLYKKPLTVFYQLWPNPLITVTKQSWINEAITLCGGRNIFANLKGVAPQVTMESVIIENPVMILGADKNDHWKRSWQSWFNLRAVKYQFLVSIDPDLMERASPRLLDGVSQLCASIGKARKKLEDEHVLY